MSADPSSTDAWNLLGLCKFARKDEPRYQTDPTLRSALLLEATQLVGKARALDPSRLDVGTNYGEVLRAYGRIRAARAVLRRVLRQHAAMAAAAAATNAADSGGGNGGGGGVSSASQVLYNLAMVEADAAGAEARGLPEGLSNHDSGDIGSMEDVLSKEPASLGNGGEVEGGSLSFGSDESASSRLEAAFTAFLALEDPTSVGWQALGADTSSDTSRRSGLLLQRWAAVAATTDRFSNSGVAATVSSSSVGAAGTGMFRRAPPWPGGQVEVARGLLLDALRGRGAYAQAIGLFVHVDHGNSAASSIDFDSELPSCHALLCVGVATQQSGDLATAAQLYAAAVASGEAALHRGSFPVASPDGSGAGLQEAPLDQDARATLQNQVCGKRTVPS